MQVIQVPQRGPGCLHFLTCAECLTAPRFMSCGWCSGHCTWQSECSRQWVKESCPPVITDVSYEAHIHTLLGVAAVYFTLQVTHQNLQTGLLPVTALLSLSD